MDNIKATQDKDPHLKKVIKDIEIGKVSEFKIDSKGVLCCDTHFFFSIFNVKLGWMFYFEKTKATLVEDFSF